MRLLGESPPASRPSFPSRKWDDTFLLNAGFQGLWEQGEVQSLGMARPPLTYIRGETGSKGVGIGTTKIIRQGHWVQPLPQQDPGEFRDLYVPHNILFTSKDGSVTL